MAIKWLSGIIRLLVSPLHVVAQWYNVRPWGVLLSVVTDPLAGSVLTKYGTHADNLVEQFL